jgi:hypothetical protein
VIAAIPVDDTRTWPAFSVRSAAGNPPGVGTIPAQPPPLQPNDDPTAATITVHDNPMRVFIEPSPRRGAVRG